MLTALQTASSAALAPSESKPSARANLPPDRRRGHPPIRPVKTLIELRLKLRGKLRNEMLGFLLDQTPAQHANPEQQCPLSTVAFQRGGARYRLTRRL